MTGRAAAARQGARGARAATPAAPPALAVAIAAALLAGATALALLSLAATLRPAAQGGGQAQGQAQAAAVRAWVSAANAAADGDAGPLARAIAPGFALHRAGEPDLDAPRLAALLGDLGRGTEGLRFTADEIVADGDWAAARLTVTGGARRVAGTEIAGARPATETAAFFRVIDGLAAEAWAPDLGAGLPRTLPPARVPLWTSPTPAILARIVIPPGAEASGLATSGIHLLLPETGAVEARVSGSALALDGERPDGWQVIPGNGRPMQLEPGDALLVTSGAFHGVRNRGDAPAALLGFATAPYLAESGEGRQPPRTTPLTAIYHARLGLPVSLPGGVTSMTLARGLGGAAADGGGPCAFSRWMTLEVTRATLAPGEWLPAHVVRGVEVMVADRAGAASERWLAGSADAPLSAGSRLLRDEGLAASDREAGEVRNDRGAPMPLVAIRLTPEVDAPCLPGEPGRVVGWSGDGVVG